MREVAEPRRSVLAVAVLSMLTEAPMHAYRMQQLIRERHKDDVVNVSQRGSLYQTLERLQRDGLVAVESTGSEDNRPERTTYRITDVGRSTLQGWLTVMLAVPAREYPAFPAALSFLPNLTLVEATAALAARFTALEEERDRLTRELKEGATFLPRVFLVESEYQRAIVRAELTMVKSLLADLRSGAVSWP